MAADPAAAPAQEVGPSGTIVLALPDMDSPPLSERPGDKIGRYKLLEQIGKGGFGVVYVAQQDEPVRRRVALKIIKLGMDTEDVIARFERERQALAEMDHPNIAKVFDAGATESGRPYFVMELVNGESITGYCDKNNLTTRQRLDLFVDVCHAIQHAHQKGIIHRDIKPSNILVAMQDGKPTPKVIDFGIAKATQQRFTNKTVYTELGNFFGTPAYMSPEQAEMTGLGIDTRSDIYSLGVLLYELLTGKTPFDEEELLAKGIEEMRRAIREEEPRRPSTRLTTMGEGELTTTAKNRQVDPPKLVHLVRGDLDCIVMKCLEKDRTRRYDTANGLALDLLRHLNNEPVMARPPSNVYRFQKMVRRNKLAFAAAAAVALSLLLGVVLFAWQAERAKEAERGANQRLEESEAIAKFLVEVFQSPNPARDGRTITVAETLGAATKKLETELASQPERRATLQATLASTYYALGLYPEAIKLQESVRHYFLAACGPEDPITLAAMSGLALSYFEAGRRDEALKLQEDVLTLDRKVLGPEHPDTLKAMNNLANSYDEARRRDEALKLREEVLALQRKVSGPEHPDTLMAMINLAISHDRAGRRVEAVKMREEVLALQRKVNGPERPDTLTAMDNLAVSYFDAGRQDEALKLREEVLALRRKVLGPEHSDTLKAMNKLALSYDEAGRRDEALKLREEALAQLRKVLGPEHSDTLRTMHDLAISYFAAGRRDEALKLREDTLALRRKVGGLEQYDTLVAMTWLAQSYEEAGRRGEALKLREEGLALFRKVLGPEHLETLKAMNNLAFSYDQAGRWDEALKLREEDLALELKAGGPEHSGTITAMNNLAISYNKAGRRDEALKLREQLLALQRKVNGPEHPHTITTMNNLAVSYEEAGRRDEALKLRKEAFVLTETMDVKALALKLKEWPNDPVKWITNLTALADARARCGRWKEASGDCAKAIAAQPDGDVAYYSQAALLIQDGDLAGYRTLCALVLARFGETKNPEIAGRLVKDCLLLPGSGADMRAIGNLADMAVRVEKRPELLPYLQFDKGLAEYRQGRFAGAVEWEQKVLDAGPNVMRDAQAWMVLALAQWQLQRPAEGRAALAKGREIIDTKLPQLESGDIGVDWRNWIIAHALAKEARELIEGQTAR
jgi:serine/threonine protein kinase